MAFNQDAEIDNYKAGYYIKNKPENIKPREEGELGLGYFATLLGGLGLMFGIGYIFSKGKK